MTATITKTNVNVHANTISAVDTVSKASLVVMSAFSGMVGLWAATCFIGAVISSGPVGMIKGLTAALTGM
ncbi:MAG: hypothetical protein KJ950_04530 [Proteobacteria bacterium]|nr:hypothetical protein [Pseudomonadota bacterium]MBU1688533.1 hypothetical protein [Pseudomonadota bacterium]